MILQTKNFGEIEVEKSKFITFESGLLGFEEVKQYVFLSNPDQENPFHWMQAIEDPNLAFVITDPFLFKKDYEFEIPEKVMAELDIAKIEDVAVYCIAVVPENIRKMTINLRGPLVVNTERKIGKQIVLDGEAYDLKHYIFPDAKENNKG
ncbi:flagellar assembly protein FliW [Geosporobacter ferrireducens]|uniref:Flagellar assembly factor FliW n=1 Tax=Geosporobacter ferrireducens TaxID=1424294 RepID=A0A1D8GGM9_9FIRM|nr:flagellar assembly protein FliW [Geosporobacter ferrireducens]AOT70026.1 flagellar assembly protein FliW [Geosporobacter ferrireducens]MTI53428.1 flagellar assembly protein FliW [Geosporobacter ferrireducens]